MGNTQSVEKINDTTFDTNILKLKLAIENSELQSLIDNIDTISSFVSLPLSEENRGEVNKLVLEALDPKLSDKDFKKRVFEVVKKYRILQKNKKTTQETAQVKVDNLNNSLLDATQIFSACKENPILKGLIEQIEKDFKKLTDTNDRNRVLGELQAILNLDKNDVDYSANIKTHLASINAIIKPQKTTEVIGNINESDDGWFSDFSFDRLLHVDSKELNEIQDIEFGGKMETTDDFVKEVSDFIKKLKEKPEFKKLPESERNKILRALTQITQNIKTAERTRSKFLNNKFNDLGLEIDKQEGNGPVSITLWNGEKLKFLNKKAAYDFVKYLKGEMYKEIKTSNEILNDYVLGGLGFIGDVLTAPARYTTDFVVNNIYRDNFENDTSVLEWGAELIGAAVAISVTVNVYESIFRRVLIDSYAKGKVADRTSVVSKLTNSKGKKKRFRTILVIPDYSTTGAVPMGDVDFDLYNKYVRRLDTINRLKAKRDSIIDGNKRSIFNEKLKHLQTFLNVNTPTFEKIALGLEKGGDTGIWTPRKLWWAMKDGMIPFKFTKVLGIPWLDQTLEKQSGTYFKLDDTRYKKLNEGLKYLFKNVNYQKDQEGNYRIIKPEDKSEIKYSDNLNNILSYIDSREDLNIKDKKNRKENIIKVVNDFAERPSDIKSIQNKLYAIAENGEITRSSQLEIISKELKEFEIEKPKIEETGYLKPIGEWFDKYPAYYKDFALNKIQEIYGKNAPKTFTKGQAGLYKLYEFADKGLLDLTESELKDIIKDVKAGMEFTQLYGKYKALKVIPDLLLQFSKYTITGEPVELTKVKKSRGSIVEDDFKRILEKGAEYNEDLSKGKEIINNHAKAFGYIFDLEFHPPKKERIFERIFREMETKLESGKLKLTPEQAEMELKKMNKGYLPQFAIVDIINGTNDYGTQINDLKGKEKEKIRLALIERTETNNFFATSEQLSSLLEQFNNGIKNGTIDPNDVDSILKQYENLPDDVLNQNLVDIKTAGEKLSEVHFRNNNFGIPFESGEKGNLRRKSLKPTEVLAELLYKIDATNTGDYSNNLNDLLDRIKDGEDMKINEFLGELKTALGVDINVGEDFDKFNANLKNKLSLEFGKLQDSEDFMKIASNLLDGPNGMSEEEKAKFIPNEILKKLEVGDLEVYISEINRMIGDIEKCENKEELKKLKKELNDYIKDNKIDRNDSDISALLDKFDQEFDTKIASFNMNSTPNQTQPHQTTETSRQTVEEINMEKIEKTREELFKMRKRAELEILIYGYKNPSQKAKVENILKALDDFSISNEQAELFLKGQNSITTVEKFFFKEITGLSDFVHLGTVSGVKYSEIREMDVLRDYIQRNIIDIEVKKGKVKMEFRLKLKKLLN